MLLIGVRDIRCLCSGDTWDSRGVPTAWWVGWDGRFRLELEGDGCHNVMSEVTRTT